MYIQCVSLGTSTIVKDTTNSADLINWISAIHATGGNDCPEFSLTGIEAGKYLHVCKESNVHINLNIRQVTTRLSTDIIRKQSSTLNQNLIANTIFRHLYVSDRIFSNQMFVHYISSVARFET